MKTAKSNILIHPDTITDYIQYHNKIDMSEYAHMSEAEIADILLDESKDHKKRIFVLAHRDQPIAFHAIHDYQQGISDPYIQQRCELAKQEAAMYIEAVLEDSGDQDQIMIMSGIGGSRNMLRCYITMHFLKPMKTKDTSIYTYSKEGKYEIESIQHIGDDVLIGLLHSHDVSIDTVAMGLIDFLIGSGEYLLKGYGAINTMFPDKEFISNTREYLIEQDEKGLL